MQYSLLAVAASLVAAVVAQQNPISQPTADSELTAGSSFNITWRPTTQGTVNLILRKGLSTNLGTIGPIATGIQNTGSFLWPVPNSLVTGEDYAVEIDAGAEVNYTPQFTINGRAATSSSSSSAAPSSYSGSSTSTVTATQSSTSTSVIATTSVYANVSTTALLTTTSTYASASTGLPHNNGTFTYTTLRPTGGESTASTTGRPRPTTTSTLSPPSPTSPDSGAASIQITFTLLAAAFLAVLGSLL